MNLVSGLTLREMVMIPGREVLKQRCDQLLQAMLGEEFAPRWWQSPNKYWNLETPLAVFERDPNDVYGYLMRVTEGEW